MLATLSLVTILSTYFSLVSENYTWPWRAYLSGFSVGFYLFLYSIAFYMWKLQVQGGVSALVYFGNSAVLSCLVGLVTGSVAYVAALMFVRHIYAVIKVD